MSDKFTKVENPQSIRDFYVNNLLDAVKRVNANTPEARDIRGFLRDQAEASKTAVEGKHSEALYNGQGHRVYESGLLGTNNLRVMEIASKKDGFLSKLSMTNGFPHASSTQVTAIVNTAFEEAVISRAKQIDRYVEAPSVATNTNVSLQVSENEKEPAR